jgi:hypothetical protein
MRALRWRRATRPAIPKRSVTSNIQDTSIAVCAHPGIWASGMHRETMLRSSMPMTSGCLRNLLIKLRFWTKVPRSEWCAGRVIYWSSWSVGNDIVLPTGHRQNSAVYPPEASLALYPLGTGTAPCPSDIMVRTSSARALGGFEEQFTGQNQLYEDQAFLAKLYLAVPVYFSNEIWLKYRLHPNSCVATVRAMGKYHDVRRYFLDWYEAYLTNKQNPDRLVLAALHRALRPYRKPHIHHLFALPSKLRNRYHGMRNLVGRIIR